MDERYSLYLINLAKQSMSDPSIALLLHLRQYKPKQIFFPLILFLDNIKPIKNLSLKTPKLPQLHAIAFLIMRSRHQKDK